MAYIVMAYVLMAYIVTAYIVMACAIVKGLLAIITPQKIYQYDTLAVTTYCVIIGAIVKILLAASARVALDDNGQTALHYAARSGASGRVLRILVIIYCFVITNMLGRCR